MSGRAQSMNEDVVDGVGEFREGGGDGVLPLGAAANEERGRGGVSGELEQLVLVAVGDDEGINYAAAKKGGGGVGEDGFARERGEDFVGHAAGHASAAAGGEEDGGGAWHGIRKE